MLPLEAEVWQWAVPACEESYQVAINKIAKPGSWRRWSSLLCLAMLDDEEEIPKKSTCLVI
jgi:hypothetical protein